MGPRTRTERDDALLLERIRKGDNEAFERLFDRYEAAIYRFCLLMLGDPDAARDIHQEAFFGLYRTCRRNGQVRSVYGWLMSMARSRCHNYLRDRRRHEALARSQPTETTIYPNYITDLDLEKHLHHALLAIPDHYREAILLYEVEGYSYREIAELLDIDFHKVKNRIYQAKLALQKILTPILDRADSQ